eukprot:CAMPEP_0119299810 /NCGR_PEP_ID=MMETSP1333-20130426/1848_1 /TAXON_ID=418940 /ORGANISM="Scyphosphaera apsteinii, Strain RCC1455" /LENGTH=725 /DNA_ID=CAMNT_0007301373 /DNA_START=120 /DNA_END=2297 /DNA_ORIENTATION=+
MLKRLRSDDGDAPTGTFLEQELTRVREEAWNARREAEETRIKSTREISEAKLALLKEKQHNEDLELQREFLMKGESRLREQLAELRALAEGEQAARQRESSEARTRLEALRDQTNEDAQREKDAYRQRVAELSNALESERTRRIQLETAAASTPHTAAFSNNTEASADSETLAPVQSELATARRRLQDVAQLEHTNASLRSQCAAVSATEARLREAEREVAGLMSERRELKAAAGDAEQLRRQLKRSEVIANEYERLTSEHLALAEQLRQWGTLFEAEGTPQFQNETAPERVPAAAESGVGGSFCGSMSSMSVKAAQVHGQFAALRLQREESVQQVGMLQGELREVRFEKRASDAALSTLQIEAKEQAAKIAELEAGMRRAELRAGEESAKCEGLTRWVTALEEDREMRRLSGSACGGGTSASTGGTACREVADLSDVSKKLMSEASSAREERLQKVLTQLDECENRLHEALKDSKAAKEEAAMATAAQGELRERLELCERQRDDALARCTATSDETPAKSATEGEGGAEDTPETSKGAKVLHMTDNPTSAATSAQIEALKAKVQALQLQLQAQFAGSPPASHSCSVPDPAADGGSLSAATPQVSALQSEVSELRQQVLGKERLATVFTEKIAEFRKAVKLITGFRVDLHDAQHEFHLYPIYAPNRGDALVFRPNAHDEMELLASPLAARLPAEIEQYLQRCHSIPAFLSAVNLRLFSESRAATM